MFLESQVSSAFARCPLSARSPVQKDGVLCEFTRRHLVQALGKPHVAFVWGNLHARVPKMIGLGAHRFQNLIAELAPSRP